MVSRPAATFLYLRTLGCEHWQAEEISQEAFLRLLAARQDGALIQDIRAWLFGVARNQWIDSRRERQRIGLVYPLTQSGSESIAMGVPIPSRS